MSLALIIVAIILFVLAALSFNAGRLHFGWLGLAFLAASMVVSSS